jgi:hypothetical protein
MPKTTRKYPTDEKTTTQNGKNEYQKLIMREKRKTNPNYGITLPRLIKQIEQITGKKVELH